MGNDNITASEAMARIEKHEEVCAVRYGHLNDGLKKLEEGVEGIKKIQWTLLMSVAGALAAAVFKLVLK